MTTLLVASDRWHPHDVQPTIVVPFANAVSDPHVLKATKTNLETQGFYPRYVDMLATLGEDFAYDRLIRELWDEGAPFILVEHDVLPWPGALGQLWECACSWGAFRYYIFGELRAQLGCVKLNPAELGECPLPAEPGHWAKLDGVLINELLRRGHSGHPHDPPVSHLNLAHQRMTRSVRVAAV